MKEPDTQIEFHMARLRKLDRAEVEMKKDRLLKHLPEYKACVYVLAEMDEAQNIQMDQGSDRRHRESIAVDRSARNIGAAAFAVAVVALGVAAFALPQVQTLLSPQSISQSLPESEDSPRALSIPASPPSSKDDKSTLPTTPTTPKQPEPPLQDRKPKVTPTPPTE